MDNNHQNGIFSDYTLEQTSTHSVSKSFIAHVFLWMFGALAVSTLFAYIFATNSALLSTLISGRSLSTLGWIILLSPFGLLILIHRGIQRLPASIIMLAFLVFSALIGISLCFILLRYSSGSIIGAFASASVMFGIMAFLGYTTNKDLTSFGLFMKMGLIGIIAAMLINFAIKSHAIDYIISLIGVAVFTGLTAYDVQKLKRISVGLEYEGIGTANVRKLSVLGALMLYLDFINLFLMLLSFSGGRRK